MLFTSLHKDLMEFKKSYTECSNINVFLPGRGDTMVVKVVFPG